MFENGKPNIVMNSFYNFIPENSLKLGIVVFVMLNKMFVTVLIIDFYSQSLKPSL